MDREIMEQFQKLTGMMSKMATKDDIANMATKDDIANMATKDDIANMATKDDLREEIRQSETRVKVFIENTVTDKIKSLFDGYKSALENQASLKVANQTLAQEVDNLKMRVAALEEKTA